MKVFDTLKIAMKNLETLNDIVANNISNVSTTGFKKVLASIREAGGEPSVKTRISESPGQHTETGNGLDFVIDGNGYFVVQTDRGTRYTKNGCFRLNRDGEIVTQGGYRVLGKNGRPIAVPPKEKIPKERGGGITVDHKNIIVSQKGEVYVDENIVGTFKIVSLSPDSTTQEDGSTFLCCPSGKVSERFSGEVRQNVLEGSNVNVIDELVSMIKTTGVFRVYGRMTQVQDDVYKKIVQLNSR